MWRSSSGGSTFVTLRRGKAVEVRSVVLRQVEVWVGSVTAVGARSGLEGHGESGFGTGMARFGLAVEV